MPNCGSQCWLCDLPIRFDTYKGCSHACRYCFANAKRDLTDIKPFEGVKALESFINGGRNIETRWCDWKIPIHWGGMSDPFQPCEAIHGRSYEALKLFKKTQYPFVVSTKGKLIADEKYLNIIRDCNCVVQISAVCSKYDVIEKGCPTFRERMEIVNKLSKAGVKRIIIRVQPYMHEVFKDIYNNLEVYKEMGAYGVIIEGMKFKKKKKGLIKVAGDYTYPYDLILNDFMRLKKRAHELGLKIYAGENRIRKYGDSLTCCGVDGLEGFTPNHFNLNHLLNEDDVKPTENMKKPKTGGCFRLMYQTTIEGRIATESSFEEMLSKVYREKKKTVEEALGVRKV